MDTKLPWSSRVVSYRSLVRPESLLSPSRTMADSSLKPLVIEPMICRLPSRTYSFLSDMCPPTVYIPTAFAKSLGIPRKVSGVAHSIAKSGTPVIFSSGYPNLFLQIPIDSRNQMGITGMRARPLQRRRKNQRGGPHRRTAEARSFQDFL